MKFIFITFFALLCSYYYSLGTGPLGDDFLWIQHNSIFHTLSGMLKTGLGDRPLLMSIIWFEGLLFGKNLMGFRISHLFIHAIAAYQLYKLIIELSSVTDQRSNYSAMVISFLFAMHPLHNQSINIVIQGGVIITGLCGIVSLRYFFKYLADRAKKNAMIMILFIFLGVMAKPNISYLPLFFVMCIFMYKKESLLKYKYLLLTFIPLTIPLIYYKILGLNNQVEAPPSWAYFLTQCRVIFTYFRLIILPYDLKYLYDFYPPDTFIFNVYWGYFIAHLLIVFSAFKIFKQRLDLVLFLGFYLSFLPESSFFPIKHLAFEHRTYFPMIMLFTLLGVLSVRIQIVDKKFVRGLLLIMLLVCVYFNQIRNFQIKPRLAWIEHTLENSVTDEPFVFGGVMLLLEHKQLEAVNSLIESYKKVNPQPSSFAALYTIVKYYQNELNETELFDKILIYVENKNLDYKIRNMINTLMTKGMQQNEKLENLILQEKLISKQMYILYGDIDKYRDIFQYYKVLANRIVDESNKKPNLIDKIDSLKIKTILHYYHNQHFPGLSGEIDRELKNYPESVILLRLKQMVPN